MVVNRRTNAGEFVGSDGEFMFAPVWGTPWCLALWDTTQEHLVRSGKPLIIQLGVLNVEVGTAK